MTVAFYLISNTFYDYDSQQTEFNAEYSMPLDVRDVEFMGGVNTVLDINNSLYKVHGIEPIKVALDNETVELFACYVTCIDYDSREVAVGYSSELSTKYNAIIRKRKIRGILDESENF